MGSRRVTLPAARRTAAFDAEVQQGLESMPRCRAAALTPPSLNTPYRGARIFRNITANAPIATAPVATSPECITQKATPLIFSSSPPR